MYLLIIWLISIWFMFVLLSSHCFYSVPHCKLSSHSFRWCTIWIREREAGVAMASSNFLVPGLLFKTDCSFLTFPFPPLALLFRKMCFPHVHWSGTRFNCRAHTARRHVCVICKHSRPSLKKWRSDGLWLWLSEDVIHQSTQVDWGHLFNPKSIT